MPTPLVTHTFSTSTFSVHGANKGLSGDASGPSSRAYTRPLFSSM